MIKKILGVIMGIIMGITVVGLVPVMALDDPVCSDPNIDADAKEIAGCSTSSPDVEDTLMEKIKKVLNTVLPMAALLAVVMIVIAGIMMSASMGDAGKIKRAKNMIMYSVIGMIVALLAYAIVNFVLDHIE